MAHTISPWIVKVTVIKVICLSVSFIWLLNLNLILLKS